MFKEELPPEILSQLTPEERAAWDQQKNKLEPIITTTIGAELKEEGWDSDSPEEMAETEYRIKEGLDDAIETENVFSSEIPLNKSGLPPCQRAKLESERTIQAKDPRLDK